jgi:hypothetical protein
MYGLIHQAIRDLVVDRFGSERWLRICLQAKVSNDDFLTFEAYPDPETLSLVSAASDELNIAQGDLLESFGEYWTTYTAVAGYGHLMDAAGSTLEEFVHNLDRLHAQVRLTFPDLTPPSFRVSELPGGSLEVLYLSEREGLGRLALGVLKGLVKRFEKPVGVTHQQRDVDGVTRDVFTLERQPG